MSIKKEHWIMLILCAIALFWYQLRTPYEYLFFLKEAQNAGMQDADKS